MQIHAKVLIKCNKVGQFSYNKHFNSKENSFYKRKLSIYWIEMEIVMKNLFGCWIKFIELPLHNRVLVLPPKFNHSKTAYACDTNCA